MARLVNPYFRWRSILALGLIIALTYLFWTTSRYQSLGDKALLGGSIQLEDPLSFVARFPIEPNFPVWKKIGLSTLNWLDTNRQGMTFGVLFGSVFLTLMRYIQTLSFKSRFANALAGLIVGTPLGVCVNCAAPIAKGMYDGGARAETTLSTMIASPTLNIVVLSMLFSILPFYMAVTKVVLCLLLILALIPLICRLLPPQDIQISDELKRSCPIPEWAGKTDHEAFRQALPGFAKNLSADFWYIFKLTVPLMILAGFLGALISTLVPIESLVSFKYGLIGLCIVALIGTFLPVPIAFDVVICGALLAAGLPIGYVMVLLFTLGSYSIYSAFIVTQTISWRPAVLLYITVMALGILSGLGAHQYHKMKSQNALDLLTGQSAETQDSPAPVIVPSEKLAPRSSQISTDYDVSLSKKPFQTRSAAGPKLFTQIEAHNLGMDQPIEFSFKDMWPPYWEGRSISGGDIDRDGDIDVLIASTENGLYLYENNANGQFIRSSIANSEISNLDIFNAALVDINNDGWLDVFITTYGSGNFILENQDGQLNRLSTVANNPQTPLTLSLSFGDIDRDGDLDAALGNWAAGWYRRVPGEESRNRIIFNKDGELDGSHYKSLPAIPGESLTTLLTDINGDQNLDLLIGNDFEIPDAFYYGDGTGQFTQIKRKDGLIPHTTTTTMAIKNNDLDNDLIPEIYVAQIAGRSSGISERLNMQPIETYCDGIERHEDQEKCRANMAIKAWYKSGNNFDPSYAGKCLELPPAYEKECKAMLVKDLAIQAGDPTLCDLIDVNQTQARKYCQVHFWPSRPLTNDDIAQNFKQINGRNVLLKRGGTGPYKDQAIEASLEVGGWSWDTKIADFDNDEWQDILIVNGTWVPNEVTPSNLFFRNQGRGTFEQEARKFGLEDFAITATALHVDFDNDGDLDIFTVPVNAPLRAFINNSQSGNAIRFSFRDDVGNHFGIGHKVTIHYADTKTQIQELQLGGGFQSFDVSVLHFGLGDHEAIDHITIDWAEGGQDNITGPFAAGSEYVISRTETSSASD